MLIYMRKNWAREAIFVGLATLMALSSALAESSVQPALSVFQDTLSNGLRVIVKPDHR